MTNKLKVFFTTYVLLCFLLQNGYGQTSMSSIVRIYASKGGDTYAGTGFFVYVNSKSYIATCYHNISGCNQLWAKSSIGGNIEGITIAGFDDVRDIALLNYKRGENLNPISLQIGELPVNPVSIKGFTIGNPNSITEQRFEVKFTSISGLISNQRLIGNNGRSIFKSMEFDIIPIDLTVYGGMSGAPVIVNSYVVGILSGSINTGGSLSWAIPTTYFKGISFLPRALPNGYNLEELKSIQTGNKSIFRSVVIDEDLSSNYSPLEDIIKESESLLEGCIKDIKNEEETINSIIDHLDRGTIIYDDDLNKKIWGLNTDYIDYSTEAYDKYKSISGNLKTSSEIFEFIENYPSPNDAELPMSIQDLLDTKANNLSYSIKSLGSQYQNKSDRVPYPVSFDGTNDSYYISYLKKVIDRDKSFLEFMKMEVKLIRFIKLKADLLFELKGISDR